MKHKIKSRNRLYLMPDGNYRVRCYMTGADAIYTPDQIENVLSWFAKQQWISLFETKTEKT